MFELTPIEFEKARVILLEKTEDKGDCIEWTGNLDNGGYGILCLNKKRIKAHRVSYFLAHGETPKECVCHTCDNKKCVNPDHLFDASRAINNLDRQLKGRTRVHNSKLNAEKVRAIRAAYVPGVVGFQRLATKYEVGRNTIRLIIRNRIWKFIHA